jgi:hypothetical protein
MSKLTMTEQATAPDTPGTGQVVIYPNTDGVLCTKDDAGTVRVATFTGVANTFTAAQTFSDEINVRQHTSNNAWSIDVANGTVVTALDSAVFQFSTTTVFSGLVMVGSTVDGQAALFMCAGGVVVKISDGGNVYSTTFDTASKTNVYYHAGSTEYRLQNKTGVTRDYSIFTIRLRAAT